MNSVFRRTISVALALLLLLGGIQIPASAEAEGNLVFSGTTTVGQTPSQLQSMGEWLYWVEDGRAFIAGYENTDETSLTVPYNLGGYPVVGIGHRAFTANAALKWIQIHTNVTGIADDAFQGVSGLTIGAYHGAYALEYAAAKGMGSRDLSSAAVFAEGVIDLTGLAPRAYADLSDFSVVFNKDQATFLKAGQIVYFPAQNGYITGLASVITSVRADGNKLFAQMERPDAHLVFISLHAEETVSLDWKNARYYEGCEPTEINGEAVELSGKKTYNLSIPIGEAVLSGQISVSEKLTISAEVGWDGLLPNLSSASVTEKGETEISLSLSGDIGEKSVTLFSVPIAQVGMISGSIEAKLKIKVSGEISVSYTVTRTQKWSYKNGKITKTSSENCSKSSAMKAELKAGPSIELKLSIGFARLDELSIEFFSASVGFYYKASGELKRTEMTGTAHYYYCMEIKDKVYLEITVKFGILKVCGKELSFNVESKPYTVTIKPEKKLHFDIRADDDECWLPLSVLKRLMKKTDQCCLKSRTVEYYSNERMYATQEYDVNDFLNKKPSTPTKDGYKFEGWYIDSKSSGLLGGDKKVVFGTTKMPYVGSKGTLYIYAKWKDMRPVTSLAIDKTSIIGFSNIGYKEKISTTSILPADANNKSVTWSSSNNNVATVDSKGNVTLKNAGTAVITCTSVSGDNVTANCTVTVKQSVTGITLNKSNILRYNDDMSPIQLTATVDPNNAYDSSVVWSSDNPSVAEVSQTGLVTLKELGVATITCTSVTNPDVKATCPIAVHQAVTGITLDQQSQLRTNANMSDLRLTPTISPADAFNKSLTWETSNANVATVTADGTVKMQGVGTATITCRSISNPSITASFQLQIIQAVTEITLNERSITRYSDDTEAIQLVPNIIPADAGNKSVTWETSDPNVVTVSANGTVNVVAAGSATVTCRSVSNQDVTGECAFTILQAVTGITLNITSLDTTTDEINMTYLLENVAPDNAVNKSVTWASTDTGVAEVTSDGVVIIKGEGDAVISCTSVSQPYISATCGVHVTLAVTDIQLSQKNIYRYSNQSGGVQLYATLEAAQQANTEVQWSSDDTSVATVTDSGIVTVHGIGTATITCTSVSNPSVHAECLVTVRQSVESISLNETALTVYSDTTAPIQLISEIAPSNAGNPSVVWSSSNSAVAVVSDSGEVRIAGAGQATITCCSVSDPSVSAFCTVTVRQAVKSIKLNKTDIVRYTNETGDIQLVATAQPSYAYNTEVTWSSSDTSVVTVSSDGLVQVVGTGTAVVTCTSASNTAIQAACEIEILQGVDSVSLDSTALTLFTNQSEPVQLTAIVLPQSVENKDLIWSSSDTSVAAVTADGELIMVGTGNATITCSAVSNPNATAACAVTVRQAVQSVTLNETSITCYKDQTGIITLRANVQPAYAENKSLTWSSSDASVVTVSNGVLTLKGTGTATITCESQSNLGIKATCTVTVKQPMTAIALDQTSVELWSDDEDGLQLTASITPSTTDDTDVYWETANPQVVSVSEDGLVEAVAQGTAMVYCRSARNPQTIYATCDVTVKEKVAGILIEGDTVSLMPGETVQLAAACYPEIADDMSISWSSDAPSVATVSAAGLVTANGYGTAVITASANDGSGSTASYTIDVEHELVISAVTTNDMVYTQGTVGIELASVSATSASVRRMAAAGNELTWILVKPDDNDDVTLETITTSVSDRGQDYETTYAVLRGSEFDTACTKTYTVICSAGAYSTSVNIPITVDGTNWAEQVSLSPSTIQAAVGQNVLVSGSPASADGNPLPSGVRLISLSGDGYFDEHTAITETEDGYDVVFDESAIYSATASYGVANILYDVNFSFFVTDENGVLRIKADGMTLNEDYIQLVQGETYQLMYAISPADAYDTSVTWSSTDETVATVDQNGLVTALSSGKAAIFCTANDGGGVLEMCSVDVETFLQLDEDNVAFTVYTGGETYADLGIVNITYASEDRIAAAGLNVTWGLEKISGSAVDIALEEFRADAEKGITISGNIIKLLRINAAGSDVYRLTCRAGNYTSECLITINVVSAELPDAISLTTSSYEDTVEEFIEIDTTYAGIQLPEDTQIRIRGGHAYENALSTLYDFAEPERLIFSVAGTYSANVVFTGTNYSYSCPISIVVRDENGNLPVIIDDVSVSVEQVSLTVGEQMTVSAQITPSNATYGTKTWSSSDTNVVTVSKQGELTGIGAGYAYVTVTVPESDIVGGCFVVVEDGITFQDESIEHTVYIDGITRTQLDTVQLTAASSARLDEEPVWRLQRVNGNNLTLRTEPYNTTDASGNTVYGCNIILYSLSRTGLCEYDLICAAGDEEVTLPVTVNAVERASDMPSALTLAQTVFTADVGELITITPQITCLPMGTAVPDGMRVALQGDQLFSSLVNAADWCVSQSYTTLSFSTAGLYEASFIYSYSNMRYAIPVTFRIQDAQGNVPVLPTSMALSSESLWLTQGETAAISAVFTPADADNRSVTWMSGDTSVATISTDGQITAVGEGETIIICQPSDMRLNTKYCVVRVEDALTIETGEGYTSLYRQGAQVNEVFSAVLSQGTVQRLEKAGLTPKWEVIRLSGSSAEVTGRVSPDNEAMIVSTTALKSGGEDVYRLTCSAGEYSASAEFSLTVIDLGTIPEYITPTQTNVSAAVGQTFTVDFTPVCYPAGSVMPSNGSMWSLYAGLGNDFHDAIDYSAYAENGNSVTLRFTAPGRYLFTRQFFLENLHYEQVCQINVGQSQAEYGLLTSDTAETTVYIGGKAGKVAGISLTDSLMYDVFGDDIHWSLARVSGDSLSMILKPTSSGVEMHSVGAAHEGEDVWRVTCVFGGFSESVDITVSAQTPRRTIPQQVALSMDQIEGMAGDWLSLPIAVDCSPAGSALPETGDSFWSFSPVGKAQDVCQWTISDGILRVRFLQPGYYSGTLEYKAGSFSYSLPVYMTIADEEGILNKPFMQIHLNDMADEVYMDGQTNVVIGTAELSSGVGSYYAGEAASFMSSHSSTWSVSVTSGTAATLAIEPSGANTARINLKTIKSVGTINYKVKLVVDGTTYTKTGSLTVLDTSVALPNPVLGHSTWYGRVGELMTIPTYVYEQGSGRILQSASAWDPSVLLQAIGYEYTELDDSISVIFYEAGTYTTSLTVQVGNLTYEIPFTVVISDAPVTRLVLRLPAALTAIDDEAFTRTAVQIVDLRGTQVTSIGAGAFSACTELLEIHIPASVTSIADSAFSGSFGFTICCPHGSTAETFALAHEVAVRYE